MAQDADVVVVGAGHHGLVTACYLAKAGLKVQVLEGNDQIGGGCVSRELAPGYLYDGHATHHLVVLSSPMLKNDELGLKSQFGLEYVYPENAVASVFSDGTLLVTSKDIDETARSIAQFSKADAEAYRRFAELASRVYPMLEAGLHMPPVPPAGMIGMLNSSPDGRELMMMMLKSGLDIVSEWFEHDKVRMHFLKVMTENLSAPEEKGTGIGALALIGAIHVTGMGIAKGGSGSLTEALRRCLVHHGGEIATGVRVTGYRMSGDRVVGVETAGGEAYNAARCVVGAVHPHHLRQYFPSADEGVLSRAERVELATYSALVHHSALHEPIRYRDPTGTAANAGLVELLPCDLDVLRQTFDGYRYGKMPDPITHYSAVHNSVHDQSRVPGKGAVFWAMTFAPYDLNGRGGDEWDRTAAEWRMRMVRDISPWVENLTPDNIIAEKLDTPRDMERWTPSFVKGDIHGVAPFFHQMNGYRPTQELAQYTVPGVDKFYLIGPFMHPGGGLTGAGRIVASRVLQDQGIDVARAMGG